MPQCAPKAVPSIGPCRGRIQQYRRAPGYAGLRNLAIGILRLGGDATSPLRCAATPGDATGALLLLGITSS